MRFKLQMSAIGDDWESRFYEAVDFETEEKINNCIPSMVANAIRSVCGDGDLHVPPLALLGAMHNCKGKFKCLAVLHKYWTACHDFDSCIEISVNLKRLLEEEDDMAKINRVKTEAERAGIRILEEPTL